MSAAPLPHDAPCDPTDTSNGGEPADWSQQDGRDSYTLAITELRAELLRKRVMRPAPGMQFAPEWIAARIENLTQPEPNSGCWLWLGAVDKDGYGTFQAPGGVGGKLRAHRFTYQFFTGHAPPPGMHIDHKCNVRCCVNPSHLQCVTPRENVTRAPGHPANRTHCPSGHAYAGDNLVINTYGRRVCRTCRNASARARRIAA